MNSESGGIQKAGSPWPTSDDLETAAESQSPFRRTGEPGHRELELEFPDRESDCDDCGKFWTELPSDCGGTKSGERKADGRTAAKSRLRERQPQSISGRDNDPQRPNPRLDRFHVVQPGRLGEGKATYQTE